MNTKLLTASLALGILSSVPLATAHDDRRTTTDKPDAHPTRQLRAEIQHTRGTYNQVAAQLDAYGASKAIRAEMRHIDVEINHVNVELDSERFDVGHLREEVTHIHDELHQVDESLRAGGDQKSDKKKKKKVKDRL